MYEAFFSLETHQYFTKEMVKGKVKFTLQWAMKAHRGIKV
jgi:hypothetical protein